MNRCKHDTHTILNMKCMVGVTILPTKHFTRLYVEYKNDVVKKNVFLIQRRKYGDNHLEKKNNL